MWRTICFGTALLSCAVGTLRADAEELFPTEARVADDGAEIWSGPGAEYYVTERLPRGSKVEIYRRDPGGWLAIRPPENSFSWVPARKVIRQGNNEVAEIVADDALSWVGSHVEEIQNYKWQIRLKRGEAVAVRGEKTVRDETAGTSEVWYQIEPPAGEFRWIHDRHVTRALMEDDDVITRPPTRSATTNVDEETRVQPAGFFDKKRPATSPSANKPDATERSSDRPSRTSRAPEKVASLNPDNVRSLERSARDLSETIEPVLPDDELSAVEADLSLTVAKDPQFWNLAPLRDRTNRLIETGRTPLERGRARLVLDKIEQFADLHRRNIQIEKAIALPDTGSKVARRQTNDPAAALEPRFDGSGWLVEMRSTKRKVPPYAIVNEDGKVLQYVTPATGFNLSQYKKKRVGIYGTRSEPTSLEAPLLTAQRVVDLERTATR